MIRIGITGTDTGVGKTVVTCGLLASLRRRGLTVAGMKPVEAGDSTTDSSLIRAAAGSRDALSDVCPLRFSVPLAPMVAASLERRVIDTTSLDEPFERLAAGRDAIVVEGVGGLLVPITATESFVTLCSRWDLSVLIVASNRLGAINHILLTAQAADRAGLVVMGIVLNHLSSAGNDAAQDTNSGAIAVMLPGIPILSFPHIPAGHDISALADAVETSGLTALIAGSD